MNEVLSPTSPTAESNQAKVRCRLLARDGARHVVIRLPRRLRIGEAIPVISDLLGLPAEPPSFTRYALETEAVLPGGSKGFVQCRDDEVCETIAEDAEVRVTCQPSPAAASGR